MLDGTVLLWVLTAVSLLSLVAVIFGCACGCRKTVPKNELLGLAGMVKITSDPDENVNFSIEPPTVHIAIASDRHVSEPAELNKRSSITISTATRSLPDLPVDSERPCIGAGSTAWEQVEAGRDVNYELYATVDDPGQMNKTLVPLINSTLADNNYALPADTLSPYAQFKGEHPYDQLKQIHNFAGEHPYAQVGSNGAAGPSTSRVGSLHSIASRSGNVSSDCDDGENPVAPPRSRKSLTMAEGDDILAATAIAGGIPANHDLPYMTPPLINIQNAHTNQHFSGDSQDSSKGYTSISVREPLASIRSRGQELVDSHYATVSDDSDEMYAAIEEPSQVVYTSGSETYAQIRPLREEEEEVNERGSEGEDPFDPPSSYVHATPPVVTTLKHVHSRQASSSSAASSCASPGSPKREKRQVNSPLPRPPDSPSLTLPSTALDDMYAKVMKKRQSSHSVSSQEAVTTPEACAPVLHNGFIPGYQTTVRESIKSDVSLASGHNSLNPGYERVSAGNDKILSHMDPNYEELRPQEIVAGYAKVNKKLKVPQPEPDYASLSRKDPGYEKVSREVEACNEPGYERVQRTESFKDSGYEKVSTSGNGGEFEPNYESVDSVNRGMEPNYESVYLSEPPYARLRTADNSSLPDYEAVYKVETDLSVLNVATVSDVYSQLNTRIQSASKR